MHGFVYWDEMSFCCTDDNQTIYMGGNQTIYGWQLNNIMG